MLLLNVPAFPAHDGWRRRGREPRLGHRAGGRAGARRSPVAIRGRRRPRPTGRGAPSGAVSCADEDGVPNASGSFFLDRLGFLVNRKRARFQLFARATRPGKLARVGSQDLRAQPEKPEERGVTQSSPPAGRHLPHTAARRGNRASFHRPFTRKGACTERRLARPVRLARKVRPSAKGELAETGSRKKRI